MSGIDSVYSQTARVNSNSWQEAKIYGDRADGVPSAVQAQLGINSGFEKGVGPAYKVELSSQTDSTQTDSEIRRMKQTGKIECQTCKERKYQDGSDDPGVSFKAAGHISPESSAAVVQAHEQEHVGHEQANARKEGRKVIAQSVQVYNAVCPECGRVYVSGGETRTTTAANPSKELPKGESSLGSKVDLVA